MKKVKDTDYLYLSSYLQAKAARRGENAEDKAAVYRELSALAPDPQIVDFFRLKYDYHNAKVLLKSEAQGISADELLLDLGRVPARELREKLLASDFRGLPAVL